MLCIMPNYQTTKTGNFGLSNLTCPFLMGSKTDCFSLSWYADLLQGSCLLALQLQLTCCSLFFVDPGDIGHNDDELDLLCSKQNKAGTPCFATANDSSGHNHVLRNVYFS